MYLIKWVNERIKTMDLVDIQMIKLSVIAFTLMVAKLWNEILSLEWYYYAILFLVFMIRPCMTMFKK